MIGTKKMQNIYEDIFKVLYILNSNVLSSEAEIYSLFYF